MVAYVLLIAVLNLNLGFLAAIYVGWRYRRLMTADGGDAEADEWPCQVAAETPEPGLATEEFLPEEVDCGPSPELLEAGPTPENRPRSSATATMEEFRDSVERFDDQVADLVMQLRRHALSGDAALASACAESFRATNDGQLASCERAQEDLEQLAGRQDGLRPQEENLRAAIQQETAQIQATNEAIRQFDAQNDLGESCRRVAAEADSLLQANHRLRDATEDVFAEVAPGEHVVPGDDASHHDRLTGLANRTGLEAALADCWEENGGRVRQLCLVLFDVDQFDQLEEIHGPKAGDRLLRALGQLLQSEVEGKHLMGRLGGQRFLLTMKDAADIRAAAHEAERLRQTVDAARFELGDQQIRVTVSGGVVEAIGGDNLDSLLERAEATLAEAKRYKGNRIFIHDGKYPSPAAPPSFTISPRTLPL